MASRPHAAPDVFSAEELARVSGRPVRQVRALISAAAIPTVDGALVARHDAVQACRALRDGRLSAPRNGSGSGLFSRDRADTTRTGRSTGVSVLVASSVHAAVLAVVLFLATVAIPNARPDDQRTPPELTRLVFLAEPGPGGGGGGGGLRTPTPPPKAERVGPRPVSSPLPRRQLPKLAPPRPTPKPPPPPPPEPLEREPLPPLLAPLAAIAADLRDTPGLLAQVMAPPPPVNTSRGSGIGGGVGSGAGVGVGQGTGRGVGPGEGGGTGGGPYRPGSGIEPPGLLSEVTPDYTEQARRIGLEGEVLLEVVVGPDGSVSDVRVLRRLGSGLDGQAVEAVRQWRFSPARRFGTPVAVIVEVAVEFKLR